MMQLNSIDDDEAKATRVLFEILHLVPDEIFDEEVISLYEQLISSRAWKEMIKEIEQRTKS